MSIFDPRWYVEQMKHWSFRSYMLLMFGLGAITASTVSHAITPIAIWTWLAAVLGFTCTIAITNAKPLNGVLGLVSALIYIFVAINAKNFSDVVLQLSYIVLLDIPVLISPQWAKDAEKHIHGLTAMKWFNTAVFFFVSWGLLYLMDTRVFISPRPITDSVAAAIGFTGALLCTLRFREQYYFWTAQGIMSIVLWGITATQGDASPVMFLTYIMYFMNDMIAFFDSHIHWFHKDASENRARDEKLSQEQA
ncbi:nicotinamide mononucleotide transporter [Companilactobacillus zhachilii]|uniref:nicotinamide riboside transporter PnuC n=1 Tax=Companilactobacillus zhachilii TaxID=2304606 RepID=UPI0019225038|nr:nicotinamide riboside transporter PnuC [Companilactobacillus zhachilii]MBL3529950.1 nicotinamide mononucleotide transporter [Companilactobacillus zhachilii]